MNITPCQFSVRDFIVFPGFSPREQGEKEALPESRETFEVAAARTCGLVNLVLSCQTIFFECEHPFVNKPMVKTEPTVPSTRL